MRTIRHYYDDLPENLAMPPELHHKQVEVILLVRDELKQEAPSSLKSWITSMPFAGGDNLFERQTDTGRKDLKWDC